MITLLENLSYPEVEAYLKKKDMVLVPVGSVEQHSPYGLMGTDFITAGIGNWHNGIRVSHTHAGWLC